MGLMTIFILIIVSLRNEEFGISYGHIAQSLIFGIFCTQYHLYQEPGWFWFWTLFIIYVRCNFTYLIYFSRATDVKVMLNNVSQTVNSHPECPLYPQYDLHYWSEKSNFCSNRFVSSKQRFWYII